MDRLLGRRLLLVPGALHLLAAVRGRRVAAVGLPHPGAVAWPGLRLGRETPLAGLTSCKVGLKVW